VLLPFFRFYAFLFLPCQSAGAAVTRHTSTVSGVTSVV
jgi:hypothetical protein